MRPIPVAVVQRVHRRGDSGKYETLLCGTEDRVQEHV